MQGDEQRSFDQRLELIKQHKPRTQTRNLARLWELLPKAWRNAIAFMTHKYVSPTQLNDDDWRCEYGWKAKIYAYLPAIEEERDWLENIYCQSSRKQD